MAQLRRLLYSTCKWLNPIRQHIAHRHWETWGLAGRAPKRPTRRNAGVPRILIAPTHAPLVLFRRELGSGGQQGRLGAYRRFERHLNNCFSTDAATFSRTHGSRVHTHARQMRTSPGHMGTSNFTRLAAGAATTAPARDRGLVGTRTNAIQYDTKASTAG